MKVIYVVPPLKNAKGYATVGQNRQFQWYRDPTFIYPLQAATAMTMLHQKGHLTEWIDCVAEGFSDRKFAELVMGIQPDYIIYEAPTPLINRYLEIIDGFKSCLPNIKHILCGEHITLCPEDKGRADHTIEGGQWNRKAYRIITGGEWIGDLPHIDRQLTRWWLYGYKNGNYKYIPATYIQSAFDCWYGKCTFCSWAEYHKKYTIRSVDDVLDEVEKLICMGFKEIFDDSGTFPTGEWLREFCNKVIERGYNDYAAFGCNMRFGALDTPDFSLLSNAGFRMLLWGLESVNQKTLDALHKGYDVKVISRDLILAKAAGLDSHLTCMFGYPFEDYAGAKRTSDMVKHYLNCGYAFSAQATICIPYPNTELWKFCKGNGLLLTENWDEYDMTQAVMKIPYSEKELFKLQKGIYDVAYNPKFIWQKLKHIKGVEDLKYYFRIGRKIYNRFGDFYQVGKATK